MTFRNENQRGRLALNALKSSELKQKSPMSADFSYWNLLVPVVVVHERLTFPVAQKRLDAAHLG